MTAEIIELDVDTTLDIPPEKILRAAIEANLSSVMVIGETSDGGFYCVGSSAYNPDLLWLLKQAEKQVLEDE